MEVKNLKRENPEAFTFHPSKILKRNEQFKENLPPDDLGKVISNKNSEEKDLKFSLYTSIKNTPKKGLQLAEDPVTPNTNMKMLTSLAASLDYANCSTPKSTKAVQNKILEDAFQCDEESLATKPSRKEKSLSLICFKFLDIYPLHPEQDSHIIISLDDVSKQLKIERRRLYDIVNVFESIEMLRKISKNRYFWSGINNLLSALQKIKMAAIKEGIERKLKYVLKLEERQPSIRSYCILDEVEEFNRKLAIEDERGIQELMTSVSPYPGVRKEKSLAVMSQKFLMLFLVSPSKTVSLNVAAKVLNGFQKDGKGAQIKTQIRRLYDIANVLSSVGLIQKEVTKGITGRKPLFKYIGPLLNDSQVKEEIPKTLSKSSSKIKPKSLIRHSSFQEICAVAELERQKLYLEEAPKSAPPFVNQANETFNNKIDFEGLQIGVEQSNNELNSKLNQGNKEVKHSNALRNIQPNSVKGMKTVAVLQAPQKWKVINVPMMSTSNSKSFYILNNCNLNLSCITGTSLLNKENIHNNTEKKTDANKVVSSQTIEDKQRDTILKSLNLSLSPGQIATIQLMGTSQSIHSNPKIPFNIVKVIDQNNETKSAEGKNSKESRCLNSNEKKESPINFNTSNNNSDSSNSRLYSPLSIPSGYATPILNASSDVIFFPSNSEVDSVLKKIENHTGPAGVNNGQEHHHFDSVTTANQAKSPQSFANSDETQKNIPLKEELHHISDSSSSESLNAEVSNILKEVPLGNSMKSNRSQSFLIDEKTILSPIKKPERLAATITPSPLMTPPYIAPDAKFIFNPCEKFQTPVIFISNTLLQKDKRLL